MPCSQRTLRRRQRQPLRRHQLRLEGLEKRYALDGNGLTVSINTDYVVPGTTFPTDYDSVALANAGSPINSFLPPQNLVPFDSVTDATPGIAITSLNLNGGSLWYSVDSGSTWSEITAASESSGTVLIDDGNTRLHYEAPANYSGRLTDVFTFEAYDFASSFASGTSQVNVGSASSSQPVGSYVINHTMYEGTLGDGGKIKLFSDGNRAAAIHDDGLEILDISNLSSIQRIGITPSEPPEIEGLFSDVQIAGSETSVFINPTSRSTNGAFVVDLTNQTSPQVLPYNANTFAWTVSSNSDGSMVILGATGGPEGQSYSNLYFFDTTNRSSPLLLSSLNLVIPALTTGTPPFEFTAESDLEVHSITISPDENTLYVSCLSEMQHQANVPLFFVVDISNILQPQVIGEISKAGFTNDLIFSPSHTLSSDGNTLYVAANAGTYNETGGGGFLAAYDVSNPLSPERMWIREFQNGGGFANEVVLDQSTGRIYVAYDGGVRSFAVNEFGVTDEAFISAAGMTNGVAISADGDHAFVMEQELLAVYAVNDAFSVTMTVGGFSEAPTLDAIADASILEDAAEQTVSITGITAGPFEQQSLRVTATSSDTSLIPNPTVTYASPDATGSIAFTPVADQHGTATITVTVEDGGDDNNLTTTSDNLSYTQTFDVVVKPANDHPVNYPPTLGEIVSLVVEENSPGQLVRLQGITAGGDETQAIRLVVTSSDEQLVSNAFISDLPELDGGSRLLGFSPNPNHYGVTTITVTVEDAGLDDDFDTPEDNATFSRSFDITVTPAAEEPAAQPLTVSRMYVHETISTDTPISYRIPAVNINGDPVNGLRTRVTGTSSDSSIIPDTTTIYSASDVASSLSFTPVVGAHGSVEFTISVEDGGPDNNLSTTADNRLATHLAEVTVLEIIADSGSAILSRDSESNVYADTQPITLNEQQAKTEINGFEATGVQSSPTGNAVLVQREGTAYRLVSENTWQIIGMFDSLRNISSQVLDLSAREASSTLNIAIAAGAYEINGVSNPTLIVSRGQTYTLNLNVIGHPFYLQTTGEGYQPANVDSSGFTGNGQTTGEYQWVVPEDAPDKLFYQCEFHPVMFGKVIIVD